MRERYQRRSDEALRSPTDRTPPHSAEAEDNILACCLLDGGESVVRARAAGVRKESFFSPAAAIVWSVVDELHKARGAVTLEMLVEELKTRRLLDAAGGVARLLEMTSKAPTTAHLPYFLGVIREKENLRRVILAATAAVEGAYAYTTGGLASYEPITKASAVLDDVRCRSGTQLPPVMAWAEFIGAEKRKQPAELVAGLLHRGAKMMIAGGSKSFKTWVLLDLALSVASGVPWWGMRTEAGRVLYVNLELMVEFAEERVRHICEAKKISQAERFEIWNLRGFARDFKELMPHFVALMGSGRYSLLILDPVYKILGERDENDNGEVAGLLNEFESLAVKTGAAIAFGHHHSKGNQSEKDARDRSSGAGAWTRDPDALIDLTPHAEEEHFTATFTLRNHPQKNSFVVEWDFPVMRVAPGLDPTALRKPGRPVTHSTNQVLALLLGRSMTFAEWRDASAKVGVSESTFKRMRKRALADGEVIEAVGRYTLARKDITSINAD